MWDWIINWNWEIKIINIKIKQEDFREKAVISMVDPIGEEKLINFPITLSPVSETEDTYKITTNTQWIKYADIKHSKAKINVKSEEFFPDRVFSTKEFSLKPSPFYEDAKFNIRKTIDGGLKPRLFL